LSEIDKFAAELLMIYTTAFSSVLAGAPKTTEVFWKKRRKPTCTKFGRNIVWLSIHAMFEKNRIPYSVSKRRWLKVEHRGATTPKIALRPAVGHLWFNRKWIFETVPAFVIEHQLAKFQDDQYMCGWVIDD